MLLSSSPQFSFFFSVVVLSFPFFLILSWFLPLTTIYNLLTAKNGSYFILLPLWLIHFMNLKMTQTQYSWTREHTQVTGRNSYAGDFFCSSCSSTSQIQEERKNFMCLSGKNSQTPPFNNAVRSGEGQSSGGTCK